MAQLYTIKCPECGEVFKVEKGVLMSWNFTKTIPEDLLEETPFECPICKHKMCVLDDGFNDNVLEVMCVD